MASKSPEPTSDTREKRRIAAQDTLGSFALENLFPSELEKTLLNQYINGLITLEEMKEQAGIK